MPDNAVRLAEVLGHLERFAPLALAEDWDNVGLLAGDPGRDVSRIMTCLTITPASAREKAMERRADLIVAHHPLPFRPIQRITTESTVGRLLLDLLKAGIAIYSPHTAFDSARAGINQRLAEGLGLEGIAPLLENTSSSDLPGAGRRGTIGSPTTLAEMAARVKQFLQIQRVRYVGDLSSAIGSAAVACGSGGSFLEAANRAGCQLLVTGEATFHDCLEAEALGISLLLPGHFASERFALDCLAEHLADRFADLEIWASAIEADPLRSV